MNLVLVLIFNLNFSYAFECDKKDTTIIYVNGIFAKDEEQVRAEKDDLETFFDRYYPAQKSNVKFDYAYNPSHLGGMNDIGESVIQSYFSNSYVNDSDLRHMAQEIAPKITTQKILFVGLLSSQGSNPGRSSDWPTNSAFHLCNFQLCGYCKTPQTR